MNEVLNETFLALDRLFKSCEIDFNELKNYTIKEELFEEHQFVRIVNSFLFNYSKIQDKMGQKLFKRVLIELREIDDENIPFRDILSILEKLDILDESAWDELRDIRNSIAHEYPSDIDDRVTNINNALDGFRRLKDIYKNTKVIV